ncbi:MAG TPA: serine hydrolase domain-containing protein [Actinomycetota bacterium]
MPGLAEAFERVGSFLERRLPFMHAAGAALAVTDRDEILGVVVRGFADAARGAPVRPETRFQIGSISKSFAAIVAMQEVEAGRLDLHAPVTEIVPWAKLPQPFGPITMHHLLSHTSGLAIGVEEVYEAPSAVWNLRGLPPGFAPGERFLYSNDAYKLVGVVLETVTGRPVHELLADRILRPLGMHHSTAAITNEVRLDQSVGYQTVFDDRPPHREHPLVEAPWIVCNTADGSIVSDVVDMSAYARMLLNRGAETITSESFELLTCPVVDAEWESSWYAYGLFVADDGRRVWHSGGMLGFTALMELQMANGLGCVMLVNGDGDRRPVVEYALAAVGAALRGEELPEVTDPPDPSLTPNAPAYEGTFGSGDRQIVVEARDGRLVLRKGAIEVTLERLDGDDFLVPNPTLDRFLLRFGRDEGGSVVEATHGADWLPKEGHVAPEPPAVPDVWRAFVGHYRGRGLWEPSFRVVLRRGALWKISPNAETGEHELQLMPLDDGSFRVGAEEWRPDRIRFEDPADGRTLRAVYDGASWYRTFEN